jgi:Cu(I)/Ag(I) efflux system membrane fusion protein
MDLVLQKSKVAEETLSSDQGVIKEVSLSPAQRVMANVATTKVDIHEFSAETPAAGQVSWDETRVFRVSSRVAGRVERLYVEYTGAQVKTGQPLPDLVAAQKEYLLTIGAGEKAKDSPLSDSKFMMDGLRDAARTRLRLLGITDAQIAQLVRTGHSQTSVTIYSPASGVVSEKYVTAGQYVSEGTPLYTVVPLSSVWVEAELYESELAHAPVGTSALVTTEAYPSKVFPGRVTFVDTTVSPEARTVKVRVELSNAQGLLKPGMFVKVVLRENAVRALAVPDSATIIRGSQTFAWIEVSSGTFEPRIVVIGRKGNGFSEVLSGLAKGEKVASSGGFLIDSEGQLQATNAGPSSQHSGKN